MSDTFKVVIPARFEATRLPGKLLEDIAGKPLLQHVYDSAIHSKANEVIIATDSPQIKKAALGFGATVVMTADNHVSGTDRIAEAVTTLGLNDETVIVNTQGDEYQLPSEVIDQLAAELSDNPGFQMATLCEKIKDREDINNPGVVKVVSDVTGAALYFSRSPVPWQEYGGQGDLQLTPVFRHIGIYAYRVGFLKLYTSLATCALEQAEKLEQFEALLPWNLDVDSVKEMARVV